MVEVNEIVHDDRSRLLQAAPDELELDGQPRRRRTGAAAAARQVCVPADARTPCGSIVVFRVEAEPRVCPRNPRWGPSTVPVARSALLVPLMVSSPSSSTLLPSILSSSELKVISGWFSASKNSALIKWAARFSSLTSTEADRGGAPLSLPSTSVASDLLEQTAKCRDQIRKPRNVTDECTAEKIPGRQPGGPAEKNDGHCDLLAVNLEFARAEETRRRMVAQTTIDLHDLSRHALSFRLTRG